MTITREIYSQWGTLISTVKISGTSIKALAEKMGATLEAGGRSFVIERDKQTIIYKTK